MIPDICTFENDHQDKSIYNHDLISYIYDHNHDHISYKDESGSEVIQSCPTLCDSMDCIVC